MPDTAKSFSITHNAKYFGLLELSIFLVILFVVYRWDPFQMVENYPAITNFFFLLIIFLFIVTFFFVRTRATMQKGDSGSNIGVGIWGFMLRALEAVGSTAGVVLLVMGIVWLFRHSSVASTLLMYGLDILLVVGGLGIFYLVFHKTFKMIMEAETSNPGLLLNFIMNLVLFVPCLFIEMIDYFKEQYRITTKTVWIVLLVEIILIGLRFLLPMALHYITFHDGKQLLTDPVYLNREYTLGNFKTLHEDTSQEGKYSYHYAISAWFYINPQPPNTSGAYTRYTPILSYGNKPVIEYYGLDSVIRVRTETGDHKLVDVYSTETIPYQRWNNVVINYDGGNMDVFMNGDLVGSRPNIAPYMTYDNLTAGATNGIHGGLANIVYYDHTLTQGSIQRAYQMLQGREPPLL